MLLGAIESYAPIVVVAIIALVMAGGMLILAHVLGPKARHGPVKDMPYESGMPPIGSTHRRLNVRFYIVAVLFLLFDVEVIFLWPWAKVFHAAAANGVTIPLENGGVAGKGFLLIGMGIFFSLLVFGLMYEWKKGAFRWD